LDSVLESTRAQEAAVKKETAEQLAVFHRQRELADQAAAIGGGASSGAKGDDTTAGSPAEEEDWSLSARKRRRGNNKKDNLLIPAKMRKSSSSEMGIPGDPETRTKPAGARLESKLDQPSARATAQSVRELQPAQPPASGTATLKSTIPKSPGLSLSLVGYNSEDESD